MACTHQLSFASFPHHSPDPARLVIGIIFIHMKVIAESSLTTIHLFIVPTVTVMIKIIKITIRLTWAYLLIPIIQFVIICPVWCTVIINRAGGMVPGVAPNIFSA